MQILLQIQFQQKYNSDPADTEAKMYNDTCSRHEIMLQNNPDAKSKWVRTCPKNVKSCFWAQGNGIGDWYQGNGNVLIFQILYHCFIFF